jgi:hypothetical protein
MRHLWFGSGGGCHKTIIQAVGISKMSRKGLPPCGIWDRHIFCHLVWRSLIYINDGNLVFVKVQ